MRRAGIILAAAVMLLLQGCTLQRVIDISMPPPGVRVGQVGASTAAINVSVVDHRADKTYIGNAQNKPSSGSSVSVQLAQPLDAVVRGAVEAELLARGYRMGDGPVFLLVDINDALANVTYMLLRTHIEGKVSLRVKVMSSGGQQGYERTFFRLISVTNSVIIGNWSEGVVEIQKALSDLIREMAEDPALIQALMQKNVGG